MSFVIKTDAAPPRAIPRGVAACIWLNRLFLIGFILFSAGRHTALPVVQNWVATGKLVTHETTPPDWIIRPTSIPPPLALRGQVVAASLRVEPMLGHGPPVSVQRMRRQIDGAKLEVQESKERVDDAMFCLLLPLVGLLLCGSGVRMAYREHLLLQTGNLGFARIIQCQPNSSKSTCEYEFNGLTIKTSKKEVLTWLPIAQFQTWAAAQRESTNSRLKRWNAIFSSIFATFFGALLGYITCFVVSIVSIGQPLLVVIGSGIVFGGLIGMSLERRFHFFERSNGKRESTVGASADFTAVKCKLEFSSGDSSHATIMRKLDLYGCEKDDVPRPLLFLPNCPSRALLFTEMSLPLQEVETHWVVSEEALGVRVGLVCAGLVLLFWQL